MLRCPRCQRVNPPAAAYCHFDGIDLRAGSTQGPPGRLPHEFVFPSGRRCQTFDELTRACNDEWDTARDLLSEGVFQQFLAQSGRLDLARSAQEAVAQADRDIALCTFLDQLPAIDRSGPRLDLDPRRLVLGPLRVGETQSVQLRVLNRGPGLLHGSLKVVEGGWAMPAGANGDGHVRVKAQREQVIDLNVDTRGLTSPQSYSGRLAVITNGGVVEVPVRLDLVALPFSHASFQGAVSPRDLAARMRSQPRAAVPLLESGEVARWFAANGWIYPVVGPAVPGIAGVQQFFEALGLARPPAVHVAEPVIHLAGTVGETVTGRISLRSASKKWIYARAECDAPWLRLVNPVASGPQQADLFFEIDTNQLTPMARHEVEVTVIANAGQKLTIRVRADLVAPPRSPGLKLAGPVLAGALAGLLARLILAVPVDLVGRLLTADPRTLADGPAAFWGRAPEPAASVRHFVLALGWLGGLVGAVWMFRRSERSLDRVFGLVAGLGAGAAAAATLACLVQVPDGLARGVWRSLGSVTEWLGPGPAAVMWALVAALTWAACGGATALALSRLVPGGKRWLAVLAGWLRRRGAHRLAGWVQPGQP